MDELAKVLFWFLVGVLLCAGYILFLPGGL